ncbi:hypothetical protein [Streptomyces sp. NPDC056982]|uniref:hypothetical protein n=1 Tax=Streptomyces sp. NPDC056982 TaxID=3345986 RepID=UPI0036388BCA
MARTTKQDVERTRAHLELAAAKMRAGGDPQIADTLDQLRAPHGYRMLVADRVRSGTELNLQMFVEKSLRDRIYSEAKRTDSNLESVLDEGLRGALDGSWTPPYIPRARRGSSVEKVALNVMVDAELLQELRAGLPALVESLGYKVTAPTIALAWLVQEFGLEEELHD